MGDSVVFPVAGGKLIRTGLIEEALWEIAPSVDDSHHVEPVLMHPIEDKMHLKRLSNDKEPKVGEFRIAISRLLSKLRLERLPKVISGSRG